VSVSGGASLPTPTVPEYEQLGTVPVQVHVLLDERQVPSTAAGSRSESDIDVAAPEPTFITSTRSVDLVPAWTLAVPPRSTKSCGRGRSFAIVTSASTDVSRAFVLPGAAIWNPAVSTEPRCGTRSPLATSNRTKRALEVLLGSGSASSLPPTRRANSQRTVLPAAAQRHVVPGGERLSVGKPRRPLTSSRSVTPANASPRGTPIVSTTG